MDKIKNVLRALKPSRRRLIQVYAALLYNANLKGFIRGEIYAGSTKGLCVPGLNCYSCPGAVGACPLGALQNALASSDKKAPFFILGILLLTGLILGRSICGFLCPMGLLQELLYKVPVPKVKKSRFTRLMSWLKYVILLVFVVIIPLRYAAQSLPVPAFCKYICPAGTLEGAIGLLSHPANADKLSLLGGLFTHKFLILIVLATACMFIYRAFCRFLCPLGAIYGMFARVALAGVKVDRSACTDCGRCMAHCKMDIRHVGDHECIHCGECIPVCPEKAISWKGGKVLLAENETEVPSPRHVHRRMIAWALALLVLGGALWYFNRPDANTAAASTEVQAGETSTGCHVGDLCPDFTVPLYGGGEFHVRDQLGKVTVLNFWATWCAPCCAELPCFQQLQDACPDTVTVIAIHSRLVTDDVEAYLAKQSYTLPFALDTDGSVIASLGGGTMLPMTVILDRNGHIVYNAAGSMTHEKLSALILPLIAD